MMAFLQTGRDRPWRGFNKPEKISARPFSWASIKPVRLAPDSSSSPPVSSPSSQISPKSESRRRFSSLFLSPFAKRGVSKPVDVDTPTVATAASSASPAFAAHIRAPATTAAAAATAAADAATTTTNAVTIAPSAAADAPPSPRLYSEFSHLCNVSPLSSASASAFPPALSTPVSTLRRRPTGADTSSSSSSSSFVDSTSSASGSASCSTATSPTSPESLLALERRKPKTPVFAIGQLERFRLRPMPESDYLAEQYRALLGPRETDSIYSPASSPLPFGTPASLSSARTAIAASGDRLELEPAPMQPSSLSLQICLELLQRDLSSAVGPSAALPVWVMIEAYERLQERLVRDRTDDALAQALDTWLRALYGLHGSLLHLERVAEMKAKTTLEQHIYADA